MSDYNFKVAKIYLLYLIVPLVIKQGLKAMGDSYCLNLCHAFRMEGRTELQELNIDELPSQY